MSRPAFGRETLREVPHHPAAAEAPRAAEVRQGPIGAEERTGATDRFYNILSRILDNPDNFAVAVREARAIFERYAGRFDGELRAQVESFCGVYQIALDHGRADIPQDMPQRVRKNFPELYMPEARSRPRVVPPQGAPMRAAPEGSAQMQGAPTHAAPAPAERDTPDVVVLHDLATDRIAERERKKGHARKRIMGQARSGGEVTVSDVELILRPAGIGRQTIIEEIDWLVKEGYLQILRETDGSAKVYTPTGKHYDPKAHEAPKPAAKDAEAEETGAVASTRSTAQSGPNPLRPINPKEIQLDERDNAILRKARSSGSITADPSYARTFGLDKQIFKIRLNALVDRGHLRKEGDGENARYFPV